MENRAHALAAGVFTIVLGIALVAVVMWFSGSDASLVSYVIETATPVTGLKQDAPVRYRGVQVGHVQSIRIDTRRKGVIAIRIGVSEETPITPGTFAQLGYLGVTGLASISLDDDGSSGERLKASATAPPVIRLRPSLVDSGENLMGAFAEVAARVNSVLSDENQQLLRRMLAGMENLTTKTTSLADELRPGLKDVPTLVGEARAAVAKAGQLTGQIVGRSDKLMERTDVLLARTDQLVGNLNALTLKLDRKLEDVERVTRTVEDVGNVARAVGDETVPRLNSLVDELHREARTLDRVMQVIGEQPQSIVFGTPPGRPGPGEQGFNGGGR
ncbi:MAG: MCE family protein [Betaproteobacteria bacterium]|nr:MCE family protein [Betaproteobacteria bacterium]